MYKNIYIYIYIHIYLGGTGLTLLVRRVTDRQHLLYGSLLSKNTCVRQVVLDKWLPPSATSSCRASPRCSRRSWRLGLSGPAHFKTFKHSKHYNDDVSLVYLYISCIKHVHVYTSQFWMWISLVYQELQICWYPLSANNLNTNIICKYMTNMHT